MSSAREVRAMASMERAMQQLRSAKGAGKEIERKTARSDVEEAVADADAMVRVLLARTYKKSAIKIRTRQN